MRTRGRWPSARQEGRSPQEPAVPTPGSRTARPQERRVSPSPPTLQQPELTGTLPGHLSPTPCLRPEHPPCAQSCDTRPHPGGGHGTPLRGAWLAPGSRTFPRLVHAARVTAPLLFLAECRSIADRSHTAPAVPCGHLGCFPCSCGYGEHAPAGRPISNTLGSLLS